ncbi:modulator protein [Vulcanimicrobium alpinum]|uniref:Modulator protein n=1 Tax=Vulcanimicrobium alpinum TaxID=3016050 RepID=A0AAN1XU75_UNVUL|nr:TldD/PmbA family protein [Vulcanimicrobium alpinum]BDE05626.1 modulator protein [Vulcanimicrobium alpinum]
MADPRDEALAIAESAVRALQAAGASDAEATVSIVDAFNCEARDRALTTLERSRGRSIAVRAFAGTRRATFSSTDLGDAGVAELARRAVAAAAFVGEDPHAGLPDGAPSDGVCDHDLFTVADDVAARGDEEKIEEAMLMERLVRDADARVANSDGSRVRSATASWAIANSRGFRGVTQGTSVTRSASPVVHDGEAKRIGHYGTAARGWATAEPAQAVALHAVHRAVALVGARKPPTMRVPVIFERDVAASVLGDVFAALSAANVAVGNSWLADRVGERIGSERVTMVDDGRLRGGLGSSPFDAEGVATRETVAFERGVLRTYLSDTYWGRRLGIASTGNAANGGVGPSNLFLIPGTGTLDDLVAQTERGILIVDTIGFATEHASGIYSRGARGIYIEDGAPQHAVDEFTISSTFPEMLAAIDAVAGDLRFDGTIVSPSFRVAEMQISGT